MPLNFIWCYSEYIDLLSIYKRFIQHFMNSWRFKDFKIKNNKVFSSDSDTISVRVYTSDEDRVRQKRVAIKYTKHEHECTKCFVHLFFLRVYLWFPQELLWNVRFSWLLRRAFGIIFDVSEKHISSAYHLLHLIYFLAYSWNLNIEATCSSATSGFLRTTRRYKTENCICPLSFLSFVWNFSSRIE
jgi:hypothetical protein